MRYSSYLSIILFALAPGAAVAGGTPSLFDKGVAHQICAPWDGPATEITLYHEIITNYPQINLKIWARPAPGHYPLGTAKTGYAGYCSFPNTCVPLQKVVVHIDTVDGSRTLGGHLEWLEQGVKNDVPFTATWDEGNRIPCG